MRLIHGILILLSGPAFVLITGWYPDVPWLDSFFFVRLWPLLIVVLPLAILLAGRLINPRDPVLVGWLAFSLSGCLMMMPLLLAKNAQEGADDRALEEIAGLHGQVQDNLRRQAQEALEEIKSARASRPKDRFTQYEGRIDTVSLERIRALDEEMQAALRERGDEYKRALLGNPTRGPDAWITARTREEIEKERQFHRNLYEAARGFTQFVESFEETYTRRINEMNLKPPADRVAIAEMQRILQFAEANDTYELRKLDVEAIGAALAALNVLHEAWGNWSYDRRTETLAFTEKGDEATFYQALERLKYAADALEALEVENPSRN